MENELRFYLKMIKDMMAGNVPQEEGEVSQPFVPSYIVTAVKLPTGAIEIAINDKNIVEKVDYILSAYDDNMRLKVNTEIVMQNLMVV